MPTLNNILTSQKTYIVLIAALLVSLPLPYGFSTGVLITLLAVSLGSLPFHKFTFNKVLIVPILFYFLMVASLLWTDNTKVSTRGLERQLALVLIPLAFIFMPSISEKTRDTIMYWFSIGMALFAIFFVGAATFQYSQSHNLGIFFYHQLVAPFDLNAIYISVFVSLCILFLLFKKKKRRIVLLILGILSVFLLLLSSKIIIAATAGLGVFGVVRTFKRRTLLKLAPVFMVGLGLLLFTSNPVKQRFVREVETSNIKEVLTCERFNKVYDWTGTTIRLFQARIFSEMLVEDDILFTGYGINNSKEKIIAKQKQYNLWQGYYDYNFHNQYLQAFAELGIFGVLFLFLMLGIILRQYLLGKDLLFFSLFFILFLVFITESYLWRQRGLYHFLVLYCLFFKVLPIRNKIVVDEL